MASCPKCGKPRLRKDTMNRRRCPRCGILRGPTNMNTAGEPIYCKEVEAEGPAKEAA